MTVQIASLNSSVTTNRKIVATGVVKFSSYFKGIVENELGYEASGSAAVELIGAGIGATGFAYGLIDTVNNISTFKIQSFTTTSSSNVVENESFDAVESEEPVTIPFE